MKRHNASGNTHYGKNYFSFSIYESVFILPFFSSKPNQNQALRWHIKTIITTYKWVNLPTRRGYRAPFITFLYFGHSIFKTMGIIINRGYCNIPLIVHKSGFAINFEKPPAISRTKNFVIRQRHNNFSIRVDKAPFPILFHRA